MAPQLTGSWGGRGGGEGWGILWGVRVLWVLRDVGFFWVLGFRVLWVYGLGRVGG